MSDAFYSFSKENLDTYLKALAKLYRKQNGKAASAEIVLVGGAAILVNYGFRDMTVDIDAIIHASSSIKEAINQISDQHHLPNGWLNADFERTDSYTPKLNQFSIYYKTFYGVLEVRSISAEYLIAMKLKSGRRYKNDLSDILGILKEHEKAKQPISLEMINKAVSDLYGGWQNISEDCRTFVENAFRQGQFERMYLQTVAQEAVTRASLLGFQKEHPNTVTTSNVDSILSMLEQKKEG